MTGASTTGSRSVHGGNRSRPQPPRLESQPQAHPHGSYLRGGTTSSSHTIHSIRSHPDDLAPSHGRGSIFVPGTLPMVTSSADTASASRGRNPSQSASDAGLPLDPPQPQPQSQAVSESPRKAKSGHQAQSFVSLVAADGYHWLKYGEKLLVNAGAPHPVRRYAA